MTILETLDHIPAMRSHMVVGHMSKRNARVKINPDGSLAMVYTHWVQAHPLWLIVITYGKDSYRCRVWLRNTDHTLMSLLDKDGYHTNFGAEWGAFSTLATIINGLRESDAKFEKSIKEAAR